MKKHEIKIDDPLSNVNPENENDNDNVITSKINDTDDEYVVINNHKQELIENNDEILNEHKNEHEQEQNDHHIMLTIEQTEELNDRISENENENENEK